MRVLLTGATGLIGRRLLPRLAGQHDVVAVVRRPPESESLPANEVVVQDLSQHLDSTRLPRRIDAVIHLAQARLYREFPERAQEIFAVNTQSTLELLDYAREAGARCFLYASSGGMCGYRFAPISEVDVAAPSTFYLRSKQCGEILADAYGELMTVTILRYFFVFGEGQQEMLVPRLIRSILTGDPIPLAGADGIRISPTHVEDAADATAAVLINRCEGILNVAGSEVWSIRAIAECLASSLGAKAVFKPNALAYEGDLVADTTRLSALIGSYHRSIAEALGAIAHDFLASHGRPVEK